MHLYDIDGKPCYEVPYKDPSRGMRKATLADARKMGLVPSVTEIIKIKAAPGLENWKVQQGIMAALTMPRDPNDTDADFIRKINVDAKEKAKIAADKGTAIHKAIENAFLGRVMSPEYKNLAIWVRDEIRKKYSYENTWYVEESFSHQLGYGGKVDLNAPRIKVVADIKTKEKFATKMAYDEHVMQLAAYARGLGYDDALLVNIFVSWAGDIQIHEWSKEEAARGLRMFDLCLELWKEDKKYDPSFMEAS